MADEDVLDFQIAYRPHRWQAAFHAAPHRERALIAGIRGGKTVAGSHEFLRLVTDGEPGVSILTGPDLPTMRQTSLRTIFWGMGPRRLGRWPTCPGCGLSVCIGPDPPPGVAPCTEAERLGGPGSLIESYRKHEAEIRLIDGNAIIVRGADDPDSLRGPAAKAYWCDEVTLCKPGTLKVLQGRTLDTGGRGIVTGTPKGKRNWFYQDVMPLLREVVPGRVWESDRWYLVAYPSGDNPGLSAAAVADLAANYTRREREQELEGRFVEWGGAAFDADAVSACLATPVSHYGTPRAGHRTLIGFDPAGKGKDYRVAVVVCRDCRAVVDFWREQRGPFRSMYDAVARLCRRWTPLTVQLDATSMGGQAVHEELEAAVADASPDTVVEDYVFTQRSKYELLMRLAARLEEGLGIPSDATAPLGFELRAYEWDDRELQTDCVMALALATWDLPALEGVEEGGMHARGLGRRRVRVDWTDAA